MILDKFLCKYKGEEGQIDPFPQKKLPSEIPWRRDDCLSKFNLLRRKPQYSSRIAFKILFKCNQIFNIYY